MREAIKLGTNDPRWLHNGLVRKLLCFRDALNSGNSELCTANGRRVPRNDVRIAVGS